jgi:hypothetical protein
MDPSTVHAGLIIAAKKMVDEHWPNASGSCPICRASSPLVQGAAPVAAS